MTWSPSGPDHPYCLNCLRRLRSHTPDLVCPTTPPTLAYQTTPPMLSATLPPPPPLP